MHSLLGCQTLLPRFLGHFLHVMPPASLPCPAAAEYPPNTSQGQHTQATADLLLGCWEVVMEDLVEEMTGGRCLLPACDPPPPSLPF